MSRKSNTLFGLTAVSLTLLLFQPCMAQNDPYFYTNSPEGFPGQWHLDRQTSGAVIDANVADAWSQGFTGAGVTIGIVEEAFDYEHPDLAPNYAPEHSFDFFDNELDPAIDNDQGWRFDWHATASAGVAAARGGNGIGGAGVAPNSRIASLAASSNSIVNNVTSSEADQRIGRAYSHHAASGSTGINIYSSSFNITRGIPYRTLHAASAGMSNAIDEGAIHVLLAHNDRRLHETERHRNADTGTNFLANNPDSIVVAATNSEGHFASYSNYGSNIFVSAPSGDLGLLKILTTDLSNPIDSQFDKNRNDTDDDPFPDFDYTSQYDGTSAATPLAAGVLALAKEAQSNLNSRFAKHLLARTSRVVGMDRESTTGQWIENAAGFNFNNDYGFGLIDAGALTEEAGNFSGVTDLLTVSTGVIEIGDLIPSNSSFETLFDIEGEGSLEEVLITIDLSAQNLTPGDLEMFLVSPSGTTSQIMYTHPAMQLITDNDFNIADELDWTFRSNAFWGESFDGQWKLLINDIDNGDFIYDFRQPRLNDIEATFRVGSLISAVPEPNGMILLALVTTLVTTRRRR